jgi:glycosyltransferase involved in cell wall biosynthesis
MLHTGQYRQQTNAKSLLSLQNVDSNIWRRLREQTSNPVRKCLFQTQEHAFRRYERTMSGGFDLVACASEVDRDLMGGICPGLSAEVIPNGVDIELYQPDHELEEETTLIYTGSMDWFPNEDAAIYFIEEILPIIQTKCQNLKFYVVGQSPTERLKRYGNRPGVVVTGRVDDVKPYFARATVYVVPLRIGGGTRLKILEALAMGKAVVSTSVGAEGLNLTAGDGIMIADEPAKFADGVFQLMEDKSMRRELGENGRRRVKTEYDWRRIGEKLQGMYEAVVAGDSGTTGMVSDSSNLI